MPPTESPWIAMALTPSSIVHAPRVVTPMVKLIASHGTEDERRAPGRDALDAGHRTPAACPGGPGNPGPGRTPARDHPAGRTTADGRPPERRASGVDGRGPGPPGRRWMRLSGASASRSRHHAERRGRSRRTRAVPPLWRRSLQLGRADHGTQIRIICAPTRVPSRLNRCRPCPMRVFHVGSRTNDGWPMCRRVICGITTCRCEPSGSIASTKGVDRSCPAT
jgi:hypothetical protein